MVPTLHFPWADFYESLLPDFALAAVFFIALCYTVLGQQFKNHHRAAVAMSVVIGIALAVGLVWWEQQNGYTIRDLGPIAVGFAIIFLAFVVYQAFKLTGGTVAGAGLAIGVAVFIAWLLRVDWPVAQEIINTIAGAAILVGLIAFFTHYHAYPPGRAPSVRYITRPAVIHHDMRNVYDDRFVSEKLHRGFHQLRKQADHLTEHPRDAQDIMLQLRRMMPAEGWLTERMAQLRTTAYRIREGHVARLEETRHVFDQLPTSAKKRAAAELASRYNQLIGIDTRLERLDRAVAANEKRIRDLTAAAQAYLARNDYPHLHAAIKQAEKLQKHNTKLFELIDGTQKKLTAITEAVAKEARQVNDA